MSLIFKKAARENLSNVSVYIDDTTNTSPKYFRVSDVPQVLQKGKNLLRISAHPTNLVEGSQILVDVRDSNGNPIYFEIPDYLEADKSRVISIWIYNDKGDDNTANGDAVITLVGISKVGNNGEPIPERFRGKPNVRWQTTVNVDRDRKNTSSVIFKSNALPSVAISESIEAYQNQPQSGNELLLQSQTGNGARYLFRGTTPIVQLTDGSQFNEEMLGYSFVLSNYETPAEPISKYPNPNSDTFYSSSISQVLDATTAVLRTPYTTSFADREELLHTYNNIESANYSIQYFQTGSNIVTENQRSFANLTLTNVNPIAGVVDKVKVLIKSDGLPGEYELLNEVTVPYSSSFSVKVPIPSENLQDPKLLKIQYLNSIGEISRTETITSPFVFQGGNFYFGGGDNLITGSIFISNAIGSGIEVGGASSGFMRSVGFEVQTSASLGKGPGGFIIYSGSNALKIGEDYLQGVGMQMIGDNDDRHFIFTTHDGGLLDVKTDKFFIGTLDSQFISGSDGNIEISSSLFHLDPVNDLLVIGADAVINADLTVNNLRTPALINGSPSTRTNSSSSIDSDGFARFVSASIGGFEVSETQINSANDNLILKDSGQITGSNVLFSGGEIAGFEISNSQINSTNNNLILKASGQITASDGFLFGNKGTSQYVQFDDGNLVVRGDLSVDQIFTPATINGSPANINNASSSITSDGFAKFVSASIGGWDITTGSIEGGNLIMKPEGILQTKDFASGLKGWKISSEGNGTAEFENVRIRGTMRTTTFEKESVNAVGGQLWVANSTTITGSVIANDATMSVKNAKGFESGEILIAKKVDGTGFQTEYILVNSSSVDGNQSNEDENYGRIYVTRGYGSGSSGDFVGDIASISQSYEDGQVVVSTGKVGTGYIKLNANPSDTATPFIDVVERTGSGLYDVKLAARLGDLSGLANSSYVFGNSNPGFGLATDNVYLQGGIIANTGSIGGINMEAGKLYNGNGTWANSNTGFYIDSASNFSLGDRLTWNGTSLVVRGQIQLADGTGVEEAINAVTESSTARALSIGVDSQVYAFDNSTDTTATPDTIVFTISQQNLTGTITTSDITITKDGGSTITTPTLGGVVTNGSGQLSGSLSFSGESLTKSDLPITIEVSKDSLLDTTTIFKVEGGADGADGVSTTGFRIEYSTSTTEADPGSGKFRFNATDPASATEVYISETDLDGLGVAPLLNQLTSSTNTPNKSIITFRQEANQSYYESAYVTDQTDNGSWRTVDITHIDKNGWANLSNGDSTFMAIAVLGDSGAAGADGVDGVTTFLTNEAHTFAAATDGTIVSFVGGSTDMEVFEGVTNVTSNYTISASNGAGVSSSLAPPKTVNIGALANDSGSVIITATSASVSLSKTMSLVKSKQGETGAQGEAGADNQDFTWANENLTGVGPIASPGLLMTSNVFGFHDGIAGANGSLDDFTSYLDSDGNFYLGSGSSEAQFVWDNTTKELLVSGSNANITVDRFFLGGASQFVSGSNGNLEISSSNFHLQPGGDAILNGTIYAEAGRIASFIISSSNFDALRLVEEFTPISERSGSFDSAAEIPADVDSRATINITGVTSSNMGIESIVGTDITLDSVNLFTENSDFEIFYTESLQYNSAANQSVAVSAKFQSSSISISYPTASIAAYSSSIVNGRFAFDSEFQNFDVISEFLSTVEGVDALAFELPENPAYNINPTSDGFWISLFTDTRGVPLDDRVGLFPNGIDLDGFVDINIDDLSQLTGSASTTEVSSSNVNLSILNWSPVDTQQFTLTTNYESFVPTNGFASNTNSTSPETDFINAYWTASDSGYSPTTQYIWVSSGSVNLDSLDGNGDGDGFHTFFLTASYLAVETTPDAALITPTKSTTVYSGNSITISQFNTITGSSFVYIQQIAEFGGVSPNSWSEYLTRGLVDSFGEGLEYSGSAELLGITAESIFSITGEVSPENYTNNEANVYAALLKPGWFVNPDVISILNGIDTTTGSLAGWFEIETSGSLTTWNTSPGVLDIPSWQGGSRGLPLKLRHTLAITETTSSSELEIKNGIWPLDIAESGSIDISAPFALNQALGEHVDRGGDPINVTQRLDNIRVQTDLTAAELASLYPDDAEFNSRSFDKFAVDYESTNTYNSTTQGGKISMGYQSGSFVEKVTFSISGSGEISSSKFFVDESGNITGSKVNFSGGTISGSDLNINANQFDFGAAGGFISGSNGSLIISSSLFSLTDTTLEVKGDLRASSGFIQDTYLGGKIVELGVQNPVVPSIRYQLPFIETYSTSSTDVRLTSLTGSSKTSFQGSHGKWSLSSIFQSTPQMLVTGSTLDGVGYPAEFKSWYDISGVSKDYKFINDFTLQNVANASSSLSPTLIGNQLVFNKENTFRTGSNVYKTLTSEFIHISESFAGSEYKNAHLQFAARGTTHPYSGGFTGFFPQYKIDIISGSTTYYTKVYKDENATEKSWTVFDIPISDILEIEATNNSNKSIENAFKVRIGMLYSGSNATGTVGSGVNGLGWALTEMRMVEPARVAAIDTQTLHFKDTYLTWDGKEVTAHKGHFAPIITSSLFESVSGSRYTLGRPKQRWQTAYLKNSVDTLSDRNLKKNIEISPLGFYLRVYLL